MPQSFNIGDLVEIRMLGSVYYEKVGLVIQRVHYQHGYLSDSGLQPPKKSAVMVSDGSCPAPDEYSCQVKLISHDETQNEFVMIRAKWLRIISKARKEDDK